VVSLSFSEDTSNESNILCSSASSTGLSQAHGIASVGASGSVSMVVSAASVTTSAASATTSQPASAAKAAKSVVPASVGRGSLATVPVGAGGRVGGVAVVFNSSPTYNQKSVSFMGFILKI